jgi:hypothetical protein
MRQGTFCVLVLLLITSWAKDSFSDEYILDDGTVLAGETLSKSRDGVRKVETLTGIRSISEERIEILVPSREIEREYENLLLRFDRGTPRGLAALAGWCRQKGWLDEMFSLYDRLMEMDPENSDLSSFMDEMASKIRYGAFDRRAVHEGAGGFALLKAMSRSGPCLQGIGAAIVRELPEPGRMSLLSKGMRSSDSRVRRVSIELVAALTPVEALEALVKAAIKDRDAKVRKAAVLALKGYENDAIFHPFLQALRSEIKTYRVNALDAFAEFNDIRSAGALIANLRPAPRGTGAARSHVYSGTITSVVTGFDSDVATGAAAASPRVTPIQDGVLLDVGVLSTHVPVIGKKERFRTAEVLESITGMDYGDEYHLWTAWWKIRKAELLEK